MCLRRILGLIGIMVMVLGVYALLDFSKLHTPSPETNLPNFVMVFCMLWIVFSFLTKILMLFNLHVKPIALISVGFFALMLISCFIFHPATDPTFEFPPFYDFCMTCWIFGWILIDIRECFEIPNKILIPLEREK